MNSLLSAAMVIAGIAAVVLLGVGAHELNYASAHPHAYGPANVIALAAFASAAVAGAVYLVARALSQR